MNPDSGYSTNSSGWNIAMYTGNTGACSNLSVADLTIDCNYAGVSATFGLANLTLEAVVLYGHNNRIERVKAINAAGKLNNGQNPESFILMLAQYDTNYAATGLLIRDCEVSSFAGGACSAMSLNGTGGSTGTSGILQNNRVTLSYPTVGGEQYAYNIGTPNGVIYENNIASGARRSLSLDGGEATNYIIRGNIFYCPANSWGLLIGAGVNGIIENNLIELTSNNSNCLLMSGANSYFPGVTNCIVRNNTLINRSQAINNYAIGFWTTTDWPQHSMFENNRIDGSLKFDKITSSAGFWFNNTDFDGNNLTGLSSIQTSRNVVANKP